MSSAISAQNLSIGYKTGQEDIVVGQIPSLKLVQGKLTCLLGSNGIGKSTLLKTITGNLSSLQGEVMINDKVLADLTVKEKAKLLAVVLTDKAHLGFTTVKEMITLGRNPYTNWMNTLAERDSRAIEEALAAIGMADYADRPLSELSDGNLQKVIIGRAIAQETEIIVLDEPTIHLDITNKTIVIELLQKLCQVHNKTILLATHDLELASLYADQFWLLEKDRLIQGFPEDLILQGEIDRVLGLDKLKKKKTRPDALKVKLHGTSREMVLLESALHRMNYIIDDKAEIQISYLNAGFQIEGPEISKTTSRIEAILTELSSYGSN